MPETKKKIDLFGHQTEVSDVPITKAVECFAHYELEDGSVVRVKSVANAFLRIEGQSTPDGKPIYIVLTSPNVLVLDSKLTKSSVPAAVTTKH